MTMEYYQNTGTTKKQKIREDSFASFNVNLHTRNIKSIKINVEEDTSSDEEQALVVNVRCENSEQVKKVSFKDASAHAIKE